MSDRCDTEQQSGCTSSADGPRFSALEWGLVLLGPCFHMLDLKHSLRQSEETDSVRALVRQHLEINKQK